MVNKNGGRTSEGGEYDSLSGIWAAPKYLAAEILEESERNFRESRNVVQKVAEY